MLELDIHHCLHGYLLHVVWLGEEDSNPQLPGPEPGVLPVELSPKGYL